MEGKEGKKIKEGKEMTEGETRICFPAQFVHVLSRCKPLSRSCLRVSEFTNDKLMILLWCPPSSC